MSYGDFTAGAGFGALAMSTKSHFIGSGADIAGIVSPPTGKTAICNSTGSGFNSGVTYQWDGTQWIAIAGSFAEMFRTNIRQLLLINEPFPRKELWTESTTGATVSNNDTEGGYQIVTNTTAQNRSTMSKKASARISFADYFTFLGKIDLSASVRLLFRFGVGMPPANDFASTRRCVGLEIDNDTDVNKNMFIRSSDGTTNSSQDLGQVGTAVHQWRVEFRPGTDIKVYRDGTLLVTRTANVPSGGDTGSGNETFTVVGQMRTTAVSKTIKIEYVVFAGSEAQVF
jgi:hypothetical protein